MNYTETREEIQSGDLIAFSHYKWASPRDWLSQVVRFFSFTEYCHIGVAIVLGGRVWLAESVSPTVRLVPLSNFAKDGFFVIPTRNPMGNDELEYLLSRVGVSKYSKWQAIKAYLDKLELGADDLFECAEYTICARRLSGLDLGNRAVPAAIVKEALKQGLRMHYIEGI